MNTFRQNDGTGAGWKREMSVIVDKYTDREDARVDIEMIGDRPSMGQVDKKKMTELQKRAEGIIFRNTGVMPMFGSGSTDCNIPLSMGIPAICFGVYLGGGQHTREEYVRIDSLETGLCAAMGNDLRGYDEPVVGKGWFLIDG